MLRVMVTSPERVLFDGSARRVILPGEQGTFELLPLHRPMVSRLLKGYVVVDATAFQIRRGLMRIYRDEVAVAVEIG